MSWAAVVGAGLLEASSELERARSLHREGRLPEALEAYGTAIEMAEGHDLETVAAARNNSCIIRIGTADYEAALEDCAEAVRIRRSLDDMPRLGRALNNLGIIQQNVGQFDAASTSFREALEINRSRDDAEAQVINLSNLGTLESMQGRYAEAFDHHSRAADLAARHSGSDWSAGRLRIALINLGVVFEKVGAYGDALDHLQRARAIELDQEPRELAQLLINLGVVYRNLGDPVEAVEMLDRARSIFEDLGDETGIAQAEINLGHAYHRNLARPEAGEAAYRAAFRRAAEIGDRPLQIETALYLGDLLITKKELSQAEAMFEHALYLARESGSSEGRWSALTGLGDLAAAAGRSELAWDYYRRAVDEIDQVRREVPDLDLRSDYLRDKRPVFGKAIQALAELARERPGGNFDVLAFELAQRAKVRALVDALEQRSGRIEPITARDVAARLDSEVLLEYYVAERSLLLWIVDSDGIRMVDLGSPDETLAPAGSIYRMLSSHQRPSEQALAELSARVLPDAALDLSQVNHLYISADGDLRRLPFELLAAPGGPRQSLIDAVSLSYLPSASSLGLEPATEISRDFEAAGFANPVLESDTSSRSTVRDRLVERFDLQALPGSESELQSLERWLPQPQYLARGLQATEGALRRAVSMNPRILHIGTHTIVDDRQGLGTAIVMSRDDRDDGLLFPHELATMNGSVGLSVLAACRTAVEGDGDLSALDTLVGAWLVGGSSAVLATLWDVSDQDSAVFIDQFYYHLGRGLTAAEALRQTKLAMIADPRWQSPSIWSSYILVGRFSGMESGRPSIPSWRGIATVAISAFAFAASAYFWKRRSRRG